MFSKQKQINDFLTYAKFIGEEFNIRILLNETDAHTDGKTINLPDVSNLENEEIDFMYSILLHETGHVLFSPFTKESFLQLKTENHAFIANCIEDARIENLLVKKFDGAKPMFEKMYGEFITNKKLMLKLFKHHQKPSFYTSIGFYLHHKICTFNAPIKNVSKTHIKKIEKTLSDNNLNELVSNEAIKSYDDVILLTNKIYDAFYKKAKDTSKKLNFNHLIDLQKEVLADIEFLDNNLKTQKTAIEIIFDENKKIQKEINQFLKDHQHEISPIKQKIKKFNKKNQEISDNISMIDKVSSNKSQIEKLKEKINLQKTRCNTFNEKLADFNNKPQKTEKQKAGIEARKASTQKKLKTCQTQIKDYEKTVQSLQKKLAQLEKQLVKKQTNKQALEDKIEENNTCINELNDLIFIITEPIHAKYGEMLHNETKINSLATKCGQITIKHLIEDETKISTITPIEFFGQFETTDTWGEADEFQREMDYEMQKQTGCIIKNGTIITTPYENNLDNLKFFIDDANMKVKSIDFTTLFRERINFNKFDSIQTTMISKLADTANNAPLAGEHLVITKAFDVIHPVKPPKNPNEINQLRNTNKPLFQKINQIFTKKFKITKKDFWTGEKEEGSLDSRNMWKLATQKDECYFEQNTHKMTNKIAASIAIDISGSQWQKETQEKNIKILAAAFSDALDNCRINHEIIGYHAPLNQEIKKMANNKIYNRNSNNLSIEVFKPFKSKGNQSLSNLEIKSSDNSDGESIKIAIERLKKEKSKNKILFIITDGKPYLTNANLNILDEDLKNTLEYAQKNKIFIYAFGFSPDGKQFYGNNYCYMTNIEQSINFCDKILVQ